jgi:hypothetical protein
MILSPTEQTRKQFHRTLSIRGTNFRACSASGKMWTVFTCKSMLCIRGTNFIAHWAYAERISSLPEHTRNGFHRWLRIRGNVLKVEYLGWIEYDFQKSRVTGPWDHTVSGFCKNFYKKSFLCTFKGIVLQDSCQGFFLYQTTLSSI